MKHRICAACLFSAVLQTAAFAQPTLGPADMQEVRAGDSNRPQADGTIGRSLDSKVLNAGWRASTLLGKNAFDHAGVREVGTIEDLILLPDGRITAIVVRSLEKGETLFRLPWREVRFDASGVDIQLRTAVPESSWALFSLGTAGILREFRLVSFLSDSVNLQTGMLYGSVADLVFSHEGRALAVLVKRDQSSENVTRAYALPAFEAAWAPSLSYYNLPFRTEAEADAAGSIIQQDSAKVHSTN